MDGMADTVCDQKDGTLFSYAAIIKLDNKEKVKHINQFYLPYQDSK